MTNYINSIELNGDTYAVGPYSVISGNNVVGRFTGISSVVGTSNIIIGGSVSASGDSNIIIATPTATGSVTGDYNVLLSTSTNSIYIGSDEINIGRHVTITGSTVYIGACSYKCVSNTIAFTHENPVHILYETPPFEIFLAGVNNSTDINNTYNTTSSQTVCTYTKVYYSTNGSVLIDGHTLGTHDGIAFKGYCTNSYFRADNNSIFGFGVGASGNSILIYNPIVDFIEDGVYSSATLLAYTLRGIR